MKKEIIKIIEKLEDEKILRTIKMILDGYKKRLG